MLVDTGLTESEDEIRRSLSSNFFMFLNLCGFQTTKQQAVLSSALSEMCLNIAVKSGSGAGKTSLTGLAALWRLLENPKVVYSISPTLHQAKDVWLKEVDRLLKKPAVDPLIKAIFKVTPKGVSVFGREEKDWGILAGSYLSAFDYEFERARESKDFSIDFILDEAAGISKGFALKVRKELPESSLFLQAGCPSSTSSDLFDCFNLNSRFWKKITWNTEETPDSSWFNSSSVEALANKYGKDSDVYRVRVLGQFPTKDQT